MQKISIKTTKNNYNLKYVLQAISIDTKAKDFTVKTQEKTVRVDSKEQKLNVRTRKQTLIIDAIRRSINIQQGGRRGLPGPAGKDGVDGVGVPRGGLPGQVLIKTGAGDYDSDWGTILGSDKYFIQTFLMSAIVLVQHNLQKYPAVTVHDSAGDEVEGQIEHIDINSLQIIFSSPFSGTVTCN